MFALVPCVLFADALGHEIVPLFTLASPKPKSIAHPQPGELAFLHVCLCTPGLSVCLWLPVWVFVWAVVDVCLCLWGEGWAAEDGMGVGCQLALSVPLTDRISEQNDHWAFYTKKRKREWEGSAFKCFGKELILAYAHSYIDRGMCVCVCVCLQSCLLSWLMTWWTSWLMTLSRSHLLHRELSSTSHTVWKIWLNLRVCFWVHAMYS